MATNVRDVYVNSMVSTAGPERLLLLLLDRLRLDVQRALEAQQVGDHAEAGKQLLHAQDIIAELHSSLRVDDWDGGPALSSLYYYLFSHLVNANVRRDPKLTSECLTLIDPMVDAWREAAMSPQAATATSVG